MFIVVEQLDRQIKGPISFTDVAYMCKSYSPDTLQYLSLRVRAFLNCILTISVLELYIKIKEDVLYMRVTHNFNRRLFPTKNFVPDSITFDTDHATFEYQSDAFTLDQTTTAINALDLCNEISNRARKKRAEKRGASLG